MTKEQLWPERQTSITDEEIEAAGEASARRQREADWYYGGRGTRFYEDGGERGRSSRPGEVIHRLA